MKLLIADDGITINKMYSDTEDYMEEAIYLGSRQGILVSDKTKVELVEDTDERQIGDLI